MGYPISRDYLATQFVNYDKLILQPRFKILTDSADAKVPIKQTVADAGKLLVVGADGNVTLQATTDATTIGKEPINGTALQAAIGALDCAEVGGGARQYIASVKQVDGVLAATAATLPTTIDGYGITDAVYTKQLGTASTNALIGIATLNENGKIPSSQLPAYVDDVLEYDTDASFPSVGEGGILYMALDSKKIYRWTGSDYAEISASIVVGTDAGNAYDGKLGTELNNEFQAHKTEFQTHKTDTEAHVTANDKTKWNAKQTALSDTQLSAVNSGITAAKVTTYDGYAATIGTKVDKVTGKGLSTNDYTTAEKNKLASIAEGANKTTVDSAMSSSSTNPVANKAVNTALGTKVDKVTGKGLSTNDFTNDLKTKLDGIAAGATKITVDSALSSSSANPVANKAVNTALGTKANKANITGGTFYSTVVNTQGIVTGGDTGLTIPTTAPATVKAGSMWISV